MGSKIKTIVFEDTVAALLKALSKREADVLIKRNALQNCPKCTLEQIGKEYNITRERVRQIENEGIKKIKQAETSSEVPLDILADLVREYIDKHGGVIAEDHLLEALLEDRDENEARALDFILRVVFSDKFETKKPGSEFKTVWHVPEADVDSYISLAQHIREELNKKGQPAALDEILSALSQHEKFTVVDAHTAQNEQIAETLLRLFKDTNKNILGEWGFVSWKTIKPKRMTDKAYLILKREGKPLHFEDITNLINDAQFDAKKACPATVHNELILDDKYVLVGRGLYGLKEQGFEKGTVADIIERILQEHGPLTKQEITEMVLQQRLVQKTTITLALMKKDRFKRLEDGRYALLSQ